LEEALTTGTLSTNVSLDTRKFIVGFQGGFDGAKPNLKKYAGQYITATNTFGFDCSTSTATGAVSYNKAFTLLSNTDYYDMNMLLTPGIIHSLHPYITQIARNMAETRQDTFYVMDSNALTDSTDTVINQVTTIDSSYAATYWPWLRIINPSKNVPLWVPPSVVVPGVLAFNDQVAAPWYAPAGLTRGGLTTVTDTYKDSAGNLVYTETRTGGIVSSNKYNRGISEADKLLDLRKELATLTAAIKDVAETALSTNLNKIDVIPNPITNIIVPMALKPAAGFTEFNKNFKIYCCDDTQLFDIMKNNAFEAYSGVEKTSHPLPIKYTFKILGKSGLRRGDTFNVIGIPKKYRDYGFFQITQVEQTIESNNWYTTVIGQYFQQLKS
jgi:hypothetical protein